MFVLQTDPCDVYVVLIFAADLNRKISLLMITGKVMKEYELVYTDVLIVGCGPAGLTAAAALARQGASVFAITKHHQLAPTPRAHVTNQRTFEILRDFGVEEDALALATNYVRMPDQIFLRSLVGEEFGRVKGLLVDDIRNRDASPCTTADLPQHRLEPLLFRMATRHGATLRFGYELVSFEQDDEGVTARIFDRMTNEEVVVRARFLIGADGGRSRVAAALGLSFEGPGKIGGSANILFRCDLSSYVAHRPGLLYFLIRTPQDHGGPGLGILRCIKPWTEWLMILGYEAGQETPHLSRQEAADVIRDYLDVPELEPEITGVDPWDLNSLCATGYQRGRVFCMGDAVHRHTPSNGLGSNTAIQDAYNLAWKLGLVIQGKAGPKLLDSYSQERVPVGQQVVTRATKSMESYVPVLKAIGSVDVQAIESMAELKAVTEGGSGRRNALAAALAEKVYEYQTRGLELNQNYRSMAIIDEGQSPLEDGADVELFYRPTSCPGARVPHAWVQNNQRNISTVDLVGRGRFTLLTGVAGQSWVTAAARTSIALGIEIAAFTIGPGCDVSDLYCEWAQRREVKEDGCLLVRPDGYIAWRRSVADPDPEKSLSEVLCRILDRSN